MNKTFKKVLFLIFCALSGIANAQIMDDFSDGDFSQNPSWTGDVNLFTVAPYALDVTNLMLRSNSPGAANYYLSTENTLTDEAFWSFFFNLRFATSGSNYVDAYLMADNANLSAVQNGYFLRLGGTPDEISFFKVLNGNVSLLIDGADGLIGSSTNNPFRIYMTRSADGMWNLSIDQGANGIFIPGGSVMDNEVTTTGHFGFRVIQSSAASPVNAHFFDDIEIDFIPVDETPPSLVSAQALSSTQLQVTFSEPLLASSVGSLENYNVDGGVGAPSAAVPVDGNPSAVLLTFTTPFSDGTNYNLTVNGLSDLSGNAMGSESTGFFFFTTGTAEFKDLVFNELMIDPSPVVGLPEVEYIELYNGSEVFLDLGGWVLVNSTTARTLPSTTIAPGGYLLLCNTSDVEVLETFGDAIGISSFVALSNTADSLTLINPEGVIIDIVSYTLSWYADPDKDDGGYALELINPFTECSGQSNWRASDHPAGGTPGALNSVFEETPDILNPTVVSSQIVSPDIIQINFSEIMDAVSLSQGSYVWNLGISVTDVSPSVDLMSVQLSINPGLETGVAYELTLNGLLDCEGNPLAANTILTIQIGEIPELYDLRISEIMADPTPVVGLPDGEYFELFNASDKTIELQGLNLSGLLFSNPRILLPGAYVVCASTTNQAAFSEFSNVYFISGMSVTFLTNGGSELLLQNANGDLVDRVEYNISWYGDPDKDDGGWSLEIINPFTECSGQSNWTASQNPSGGTPGVQNSAYNISPDVIGPTVVSAQIVSPDIIQINFSEIMDAVSLSQGTYVWNLGISVTDVSPSVDLMSVQLSINPGLETGVAYELTLNGLLDCEGNPLAANTILTIQIGEIPELYDLRISEIMSDPTPVVDLPDGEYFELFNASDKTIELQGLNLSGLLFSNSRILLPGTYVVCTSTTNQAAFSEFSNVYFISGMSVTFLTNGGKELLLQNANGELVDRVEYDISWYGDPDKDDGGWSLEIINPLTECSGQSNWIASQNPSGGTPGVQSSVYNISPDVISPEIVSFQVLSPELVQIYFSEVMDQESLLNATYTWNQGITTLDATPSEDILYVELAIEPGFQTGVVYELTLNGPTDCIGNVLAANAVIEIQLGEVPQFQELLISEIMADPTPSNGLPEAEYFELFNASQKVLDLQGSEVSGLVFLGPKLLFPGEYLLCAGVSNQIEFLLYPETYFIEGMSTTFLTNGGRELLLLNASGDEVDRVNYQLPWYQDASKEDGGYSLERINLNEPCRGADNWAASVAPSGGTPGMENSINNELPDTTPPAVESVFVLNPQLIEVRFTEVIDSMSTLFTDISISPEIMVASISNLPPAYASVQVQLNSPLEVGVEYELVLSGIKDCSGNELLNSLPFPLGLPEQGLPGEILINEILFNPRTGGSDFVEVVNVSSKIIGLQNWTFQNQSGTTDVISEDPLLIFPGQYLVFTTSILNIRQEYPLGRNENYVQMSSFPAYSNTSGSVILTNEQLEVVDRFDYLEDYHLSLINDLKGVSLERMSFTRPTNDPGNWTSAAERVGWATPGYLNSQYNPEGRASSNFELLSEIFSPDNDGFEDILQLNYLLDNPGALATIGIYDRRGRRIKGLSNNLVLGTEGTITWDGVVDNGTKARLGPHIILIEVFDLTGRTEAFKIPFIVAGRLGG